MSTTFHTTIAAISIGFARLSFTFSFAVSKFRMRSEMFFLLRNGLANQKPCVRTVPLYSPKSWSAFASPGFTVKKPAKLTKHSTRTRAPRMKPSGRW